MTVVFNHFGAMAAALEPAVQGIIETTCTHLEEGFRTTIIGNDQVDTGNMRDSCYRVTQAGSTFGGGDLNSTPPPLPDAHTGLAGCAAKYAWWQNYGWRYGAARPFFEPVIEMERHRFADALRVAITIIEAAR